MESGNKIKILYKENHDEITRVNESRVMSKGIEEENERMISCLNEDIKGWETSNEDSGKQILLQRNETNESTIKLQMKNDLSNKLKVSSKERQYESTKVNESRMSSENITEEKEKKRSCVKINIKELETSKKVFNNQILQQRDETTELDVKLKKDSDAGNKLQILTKVN